MNDNIEMSQPDQPGAPERRPRVLAVDDQEDALLLLKTRLRAAGFECLPCLDAASALELLSREAVDLIITDIKMPGMDGHEFCRRVKSDPRTAELPVLFLTASSEMQDKIRGLEAGGHDYLSKPVDQQELAARTRAALRVKHLQDELKKKLVLQEELARLQEKLLTEHWQKTLGQLVAGLAHEINNPLAVALGSTQLLGYDPALSPEVHHRLKIIDESLQRAAHKVRCLLFLAQTRREAEPVRVDELVRDLLVLLNYRVVMEKIAVKADIATGCECRAVPSDLGRAMLFILNSSLGAASGSPERRLSVTVEKNGRQVRARFAACGLEILSEPSDGAFNSMPDAGRNHDGAIGLYLARESVRRAGGQIECISPSPLGGTELAISLPAGCAPN